MAKSKKESNQPESQVDKLVNLLKSNASLLRKLRCEEDPETLLRSYARRTMNHKLHGFLKQDTKLPGENNERWRYRTLAEETYIALNSFLHKTSN